MNDGRLDEAVGLAADSVIRRHRRGQELIGRLFRALVARCREHLAGGRLSQALADSDKAARLGGNASEVAEVRTEVAEAMAARRREAGNHAADVAAAKQHMNRGRLTLAANCLPDEAEDMQRDLTHRRAAADNAADRTQEALDRGDWVCAVEALLAARSEDLTGIRLDGLAAHVTGLLVERIRDELIEGRTDRAAILLGRLTTLSPADPHVTELAAIVHQIRQAGDWIHDDRPSQAEETLGRLASILPDAKWLADAAERCQVAASQLRTLRAGPVGLLQAAEFDEPDDVHRPPEPPPAPARTHLSPAKPGQPSTALPQTFLMRIDGVGSYLVARGESVTVGPISSADRPQIGVLADPTTPTVTLQRHDEDYFLRSDRPVRVNDEPTTDAMLTGGEKISLSNRCRMTFMRPNAASTSAVLTLSGTRLPQADTRHIILMDRQIVLAGGPVGHVRADDLTEPIVLHVEDDRLVCRATPARRVDGGALDPSGAIPMDTPVRVGPVTMVLTAV